jgi:hypothetical protein
MLPTQIWGRRHAVPPMAGPPLVFTPDWLRCPFLKDSVNEARVYLAASGGGLPVIPARSLKNARLRPLLMPQFTGRLW